MSDRRDLTPAEAKRRYLDHRRTEASESSIESWEYRLKLFVEWADEQPDVETMRDLDGWRLDEYENYRRGTGVSASTLNSEMQTLKNWLEYLSRIEVVGDDLPEKVHVPEIPDGEESNDEMLDPSVATSLISMYRDDPQRRGTSKHVLLELLWFTGARLGSIRALDLGDYHSDEQYVEFRHRPETDTPLKNDSDGERAVGLPRSVCDVVDEYLAHHRTDAYEHGRQPLLSSTQGRPKQNTVRVWCYIATQPCLYRDCPHGYERDSCQYVHVHHASKCPSSVSPHRVRTGSITWQRDCGLPAEIVAKRVNATLEVIESYYDKATERERLERRRRPYIEHLDLEPDDPDE
ncbi:MAG: tyrosine-type recombinase/integrase [Haloarculaceae archaeon]